MEAREGLACLELLMSGLNSMAIVPLAVFCYSIGYYKYVPTPPYVKPMRAFALMSLVVQSYVVEFAAEVVVARVGPTKPYEAAAVRARAFFVPTSFIVFFFYICCCASTLGLTRDIRFYSHTDFGCIAAFR